MKQANIVTRQNELSEHDFTFQNDGSRTAYYHGYEITLTHDEFASNPMSEIGMPILATYNNRFERDDFEQVLNLLADSFSDGQLIRHQKVISRLVGYLSIDDMMKDDTGWHVDKADYLRDCVRNTYIDDDIIDVIRQYCVLLKLPLYSWTSRSYTQGDWRDCILIADDQYIEACGIKQRDIVSALRDISQIYDAWLWGDVYEYTITRDGEIIDCCGGWHDESSMLDDLIFTINNDRKRLRLKKQQRLKTMIKHRVPFSCR